ncbi:LysR family transcriptional regulator [Leisingera sp. F5]|uniref:LysR family transcriptional regulator n=1 Tax=Leisingera sp. F5 TaxID=1813816 RepID=UPI000A4619E2|nr:LysR family transcriptional regulator [Leisingera sp. F5]
MKHLPPLNTLKAFAQLAETGSFAEAARRLNVTSAAVSQQVRKLEKYLNKPLVQKHGRGVLLTEEGQILSRALSEGFSRIRRGVDQVAKHNRPRVIRITTSPSFASHWLMPKISEFQLLHPDISFQLDLSSIAVPLDQSDFDVAIRFCHRNALPAGIEPLLNVSLNVLGASGLCGTFPADISALAQLNWLQEAGTSDAQDWFKRHGAAGHSPARLSEMPGNLIIEALKRGEAVAYTVCEWVQDDLERGDLQDLWPDREEGAYYVLSNSGELDGGQAAFLKWLHATSG